MKLGVGTLLAFSKALAAEPPPLNAAELLLQALDSPTPPIFCPCCSMPAIDSTRDANGEWTWNCFGGCNP